MAEETNIKFKGEYLYAVGKRKTAIATVRLYKKGEGKIQVNNVDVKQYFDVGTQISNLLAPLKIAGQTKEFNISVRVIGGGKASQSDAIRLGISKGLIMNEEELRPTLKKSGFLTRDSRVKERKKPGLKRARRSPQWSKR